MAVLTVRAVQKFVQTQNGRQRLYLSAEDRLTPAARDWLQTEGVEITPKPHEKPEHMTHLRAGELVPKTHPVIEFRGMLDLLQSEILLCGSYAAGKIRNDLNELLAVTRRIMRCQVLEESWTAEMICGFTPEQLREQSHRPDEYFGQGHFVPEISDDQMLLRLNRLRTIIRKTELTAQRAIPERKDLILVLNRLSSLVWIWIIRLKKEQTHGL